MKSHYEFTKTYESLAIRNSDRTALGLNELFAFKVIQGALPSFAELADHLRKISS